MRVLAALRPVCVPVNGNGADKPVKANDIKANDIKANDTMRPGM
jgi:hypothetical protein